MRADEYKLIICILFGHRLNSNGLFYVRKHLYRVYIVSNTYPQPTLISFLALAE